MTPKNYYVGAEALISFTSYSDRELNISATVSYVKCVCSSVWGFRKMDCTIHKKVDVIYTTDTAIVSPGKCRVHITICS